MVRLRGLDAPYCVVIPLVSIAGVGVGWAFFGLVESRFLKK